MDTSCETIRTGLFVRFREILDPGDASIRMVVLDDFGKDCERCLVKDLGWKWPIGATRIVLKNELEAI